VCAVSGSTLACPRRASSRGHAGGHRSGALHGDLWRTTMFCRARTTRSVPRDLSSLDGIMAGSPCPLPDGSGDSGHGRRADHDRLRQTEASPIVTQTRSRPIEVRSARSAGRSPVSTFGGRSRRESRCLPRHGESASRHGVMVGYTEPRATARAIDSEGWLQTATSACCEKTQLPRRGSIQGVDHPRGENIYPPK